MSSLRRFSNSIFEPSSGIARLHSSCRNHQCRTVGVENEVAIIQIRRPSGICFKGSFATSHLFSSPWSRRLIGCEEHPEWKVKAWNSIRIMKDGWDNWKTHFAVKLCGLDYRWQKSKRLSGEDGVIPTLLTETYLLLWVFHRIIGGMDDVAFLIVRT